MRLHRATGRGRHAKPDRLPALFDAEGQKVWAPGWGRWGVLYARWRLRDGRWLQARRKIVDSAQARTSLAVTVTELARDGGQVRWYSPERFPAAEVLGPPPADDPAWATLPASAADLESIDGLRRRQKARDTLSVVRVGTVGPDDVCRIEDAAAWHRATGALTEADEQACAGRLVQLGWERHDRREAEAEQGRALGEALVAELRGLPLASTYGSAGTVVSRCSG